METTSIEAENSKIADIQRQALDRGRQTEKSLKGELDWTKNPNTI